jgi:hypothetical protein
MSVRCRRQVRAFHRCVHHFAFLWQETRLQCVKLFVTQTFSTLPFRIGMAGLMKIIPHLNTAIQTVHKTCASHVDNHVDEFLISPLAAALCSLPKL